MRVAYVCSDPGIPVFGRKGASVHVQEVVRALRRRGHEVDLLAARFDGDAPPDLDSIGLHQLPVGGGTTSIERERAAQVAGDSAASILAELGPIDLVYERYSLWGRSAMLWASSTRTPSVLEVNAPLIEEQARHRSLHDPEAAAAVAHHALASAKVVVAVSEPVAAWARTMGADDPLVVPNGVDVDRIRPAGPRPSRRRPFTVGFVGTLKPWHGLDTLVEGFARLAPPHDARLLVVGTGPERDRLEARLRSAGLDARSDFVGTVDPADIPDWLHRMDVAVAPYPASATYFSPLKLFEYLAAGLPVVASDVGQAAEVIEHGRTGLLSPPDDPVALARALDGLRRDPEWAGWLGRAGRAQVERTHTWTAVVDRILAAVGSRDAPIAGSAVRAGA